MVSYTLCARYQGISLSGYRNIDLGNYSSNPQ
jgi:hypothetical protein